MRENKVRNGRMRKRQLEMERDKLEQQEHIKSKKKKIHFEFV